MPTAPIRKYRLTSLTEPTDRMLSQLMKSVSAAANERADKAHRAYFAEIDALVREARISWNAKNSPAVK